MANERPIITDRFNSWSEIFATEEEAEAQLEDFLERLRVEYKNNQTLWAEVWDLDMISREETSTFVRSNGGSTVVIRRQNGDVDMFFMRPDETTSESRITPGVGSRNHQWTYEAVRELNEWAQERPDENDPLFNEWSKVVFYLDGKPATAGWEEIFLDNDRFPVRIGYRIYPADALEKAFELRGQMGNRLVY
jgi:hypothetical protein